MPLPSQGNNSYSYTCSAICFSGGSRLPFARLQTLQTLQTLPQASKATTLTATCPCHLFFRGFKTAVCPPSNAPNASAGLQGNNPYLQASPNPPAGLQGNNSGSILVHKPHKPLVWYWINGINLFLAHNLRILTLVGPDAHATRRHQAQKQRAHGESRCIYLYVCECPPTPASPPPLIYSIHSIWVAYPEKSSNRTEKSSNRTEKSSYCTEKSSNYTEKSSNCTEICHHGSTEKP